MEIEQRKKIIRDMRFWAKGRPSNAYNLNGHNNKKKEIKLPRLPNGVRMLIYDNLPFEDIVTKICWLSKKEQDLIRLQRGLLESPRLVKANFDYTREKMPWGYAAIPGVCIQFGDRVFRNLDVNAMGSRSLGLSLFLASKIDLTIHNDENCTVVDRIKDRIEKFIDAVWQANNPNPVISLSLTNVDMQTLNGLASNILYKVNHLEVSGSVLSL